MYRRAPMGGIIIQRIIGSFDADSASARDLGGGFPEPGAVNCPEAGDRYGGRRGSKGRTGMLRVKATGPGAWPWRRHSGTIMRRRQLQSYRYNRSYMIRVNAGWRVKVQLNVLLQ